MPAWWSACFGLGAKARGDHDADRQNVHGGAYNRDNNLGVQQQACLLLHSVETHPLSAFSIFDARTGELIYANEAARELMSTSLGRDLDVVELLGLDTIASVLETLAAGHPVWKGKRPPYAFMEVLRK